MAEHLPVVSVTRRDDGVAVVMIENPKVNALSSEVLRQLRAAAETLTDDPPGAVVITGGDRVFAAGADISEFGGPDEARELGELFLHAFNAVADIPRVTIAAISGVALGGGCELALACDYRIASDRARLGQPEILLGIIPGGGGTQRLPRLVGPAKAKDLIFTGRFVPADEALEIGLVDVVVPAAGVYATAVKLAAKFATGPALALRAAKAAIDGGMDADLASGLRLESHLFASLFATSDRTAGMSSFIERGPGRAVFSGS